MPLLREYFYNDDRQLRAVIGDGFMEPVPWDNKLKKDLEEYVDFTESKYEVRQLDDQQFLRSLRGLAYSQLSASSQGDSNSSSDDTFETESAATT